MRNRKKTVARKTEVKKTPTQSLNPAVSPPDTPKLRSEELSHREDYGTDVKRAAKLRTEAFEQARKMPTSDESDKSNEAK
jgi:hypothetical protein